MELTVAADSKQQSIKKNGEAQLATGTRARESALANNVFTVDCRSITTIEWTLWLRVSVFV